MLKPNVFGCYPDDGKQPKTFGFNILFLQFFNLLALYIAYILSSEHYGLSIFVVHKVKQIKLVMRKLGAKNLQHV